LEREPRELEDRIPGGVAHAHAPEQSRRRVCSKPGAVAGKGVCEPERSGAGGYAFLRGSEPGVVARRGVHVHERSGVGGCTLRGGCEAGYCEEWQRGVERCIPGQSKSGAAARRGMRTMAARRGSAVIR